MQSQCSAFTEASKGSDNTLTAEQLEEANRVTAAKNADYQKDYGKKMRANPTQEYKDRQKAHNEPQAAATKLRQQAAIEDETYRCPHCEINCRDAAELRRHEKTRGHYRTFNGISGYCKICEIDLKYVSNLTKHLTSKGHLAKEAEQSASSA